MEEKKDVKKDSKEEKIVKKCHRPREGYVRKEFWFSKEEKEKLESLKAEFNVNSEVDVIRTLLMNGTPVPVISKEDMAEIRKLNGLGNGLWTVLKNSRSTGFEEIANKYEDLYGQLADSIVKFRKIVNQFKTK